MNPTLSLRALNICWQHAYWLFGNSASLFCSVALLSRVWGTSIPMLQCARCTLQWVGVGCKASKVFFVVLRLIMV